MSDLHFVAVLTYGTEKQHGISSFKIGRGAGVDVLLTLFGNRAKETTPPQASYRYVHVDVKGMTTYRSYLVLRVMPDEKVQVEAICRQQGGLAWVYLWEDKHWLEFPCAPQALYIDPSSYGGSCPKFPPTAAKFITPSKTIDDEPKTSSASGLTLTQSGDWWWIAGDTYPHREALRSAGAKWSKSRREWYYKGPDLPQAIRALAAASESKPTTATLVEPSASSPTEEVTTSKGSGLAVVKREVAVTVFAPPLVTTSSAPVPAVVPTIPPPAPVAVTPDNVQFAIQRLKDAPKVATAPLHVPTMKRGTSSIAQEYVGELTGSITGNVHCYGYAVDQGVCVYLNFGGPRTAVEAIRAKLSKGETVNCVPWDGAAVELTPGEGNTGKYRDFMQNIPEARYTSVILLHEQITAPNYGGKSRTCLLRTDEAHGVAMLKQHVTQLVNVPVFDAWADYLWDAGALACLVSRPIRAGGIDLWSVELDADAWTRLICGGLEQGIIRLP